MEMPWFIKKTSMKKPGQSKMPFQRSGKALINHNSGGDPLNHSKNNLYIKTAMETPQ